MAIFSLFERFLEPPTVEPTESSGNDEVEELLARLHVLRQRLVPRTSVVQADGVLRRMAIALEQLAAAEAQPRSWSDERVDDVGWLSPDVTGSEISSLRSKEGGHGLTAAGFGGPWLPRRLGTAEPTDGRHDAWKALEALLLNLEMCRRDRARYFEQCLECRQLICASGSAGRSGGSAPAENRRNNATQAAAFSAPRRSATPRGRLPPLPPKRGGGGSGVPAAPGRRWDLFWQELTSTDPTILNLDERRRPSGRSQEPLSSARSDEGPRKEVKKDALAQHLELRKELERQLTFWETETLKLCERNRRADAMLTWAKRVHAAREELDEATLQLLALGPVSAPKDVSKKETS